MMELQQQAATTTAAADAAERRGRRRHRVLKGATLSFNQGYGALECLARNMSPGGARLIFGETSAVPARFDLRISGTVGWIEAEVRWRTETEIGVAFGRVRSRASA